VARLTRELLGSQWRDKDGTELPIGPRDILIITPYNAQIRAIREALARGWVPLGHPGGGRGQVPWARGAGGDLLDGHIVGR
jgi:hypothetical protein